MYDLVISCLVCGAVHSVSGLPERPLLDNEHILIEARHSPDCIVAASGNGLVLETPRSNEPSVLLYEIREVADAAV